MLLDKLLINSNLELFSVQQIYKFSKESKLYLHSFFSNEKDKVFIFLIFK